MCALVIPAAASALQSPSLLASRPTSPHRYYYSYPPQSAHRQPSPPTQQPRYTPSSAPPSSALHPRQSYKRFTQPHLLLCTQRSQFAAGGMRGVGAEELHIWIGVTTRAQAAGVRCAARRVEWKVCITIA
ncbi:hypothetical protein B0H16DRAFT_1735773 [Mycena metata]|uniref:Uncharacterized protein n=1 Tax=Mycena metata TaxID=1033252 RepID=A0AAD7HQV0_9AGAR|nr:hypothetical protein B0H16DRAFT_1735773 [Mycena metata]